MALVKSKVKNDIKQAFLSVYNQTEDREGAIDTVADKLADKLADAVIDAVKSAVINYVSGLTAPNGPVTGTFNGSLS